MTDVIDLNSEGTGGGATFNVGPIRYHAEMEEVTDGHVSIMQINSPETAVTIPIDLDGPEYAGLWISREYSALVSAALRQAIGKFKS